MSKERREKQHLFTIDKIDAIFDGFNDVNLLESEIAKELVTSLVQTLTFKQITALAMTKLIEHKNPSRAFGAFAFQWFLMGAMYAQKNLKDEYGDDILLGDLFLVKKEPPNGNT